MRYMLLIYSNEAEWAARSRDERAAIFADFAHLDEDLKRAGKYRTSDPLEPTTTATTIRVRAGKTLVTDGPFAETKEHLGGYYLVGARDLDDAISIAARIPAALHGSVEIRPVVEVER